MVIESPYLQLIGDTFSPLQAERETDLNLKDKNEVGDLGSVGKYKGKPLPYGAATLEAPDGVRDVERLEWILDAVLPHVDRLRRLDGMNGWLHVDIYYDAQCNFEYSPDLLSKIARLGIPFTFSCDHAPEEFEGEAET